MTRRPIIRVIVFLLLGAIVNIAAAWACAICIDVRDSTTLAGIIGLPDGQWEAIRHERRGALWLYSGRFKLGRAQDFDGLGGPQPADLLPPWSSMREATPEFISGSPVFIETRVADARGLPMLSMWSERSIAQRSTGGRPINSIPPIRGGIETSLPGWTHGPRTWPRDLPLRPLWPGFAINTIFYAGVLWLLFAAPGMVKRRIRRFRGRCIHCGYDLRGQPADSNKCPECGRNVTVGQKMRYLVLAMFFLPPGSVAGCACTETVSLINETEWPIHVQLVTTFRPYTLFNNPKQFDVVIYKGQTWSSETATRQQRVKPSVLAGCVVFRARGLVPSEPWSTWTVQTQYGCIPVTITLTVDERGALFATAALPDGSSVEVNATDHEWFR